MLTLSLYKASRLPHICSQTKLQTRGSVWKCKCTFLVFYRATTIPDHAFPLSQFSFVFTTSLTFVYKLHNNKHVCFHGFYYVTYVTGEKLKKGYLYISHFGWDHGYEGKQTSKTYKFTTWIWFPVSVCV